MSILYVLKYIAQCSIFGGVLIEQDRCITLPTHDGQTGSDRARFLNIMIIEPGRAVTQNGIQTAGLFVGVLGFFGVTLPSLTVIYTNDI